MWPILVGAGIIGLIVDALSEDSTQKETPKRLFISFAIEDRKFRDFLVAQAKNENSPFSFVDMSVKQPWANAEWKRKCREKIKSCDGVIVLLSKNTWRAGGARWEITCAREEGLKIIGMHISKDNRGAIPPELRGKRVIDWNWDNIEGFINAL